MYSPEKKMISFDGLCLRYNNGEYLAPQIRGMNNRFHSETKIPWLYDYPLANHIATYKSPTNREVPLFSHLYPSFGYLRKIFPPRGFKYSVFPIFLCFTASKRLLGSVGVSNLIATFKLSQVSSNYCLKSSPRPWKDKYKPM